MDNNDITIEQIDYNNENIYDKQSKVIHSFMGHYPEKEFYKTRRGYFSIEVICKYDIGDNQFYIWGCHNDLLDDYNKFYEQLEKHFDNKYENGKHNKLLRISTCYIDVLNNHSSNSIFHGKYICNQNHYFRTNNGKFFFNGYRDVNYELKLLIKNEIFKILVKHNYIEKSNYIMTDNFSLENIKKNKEYVKDISEMINNIVNNYNFDTAIIIKTYLDILKSLIFNDNTTNL